jgi:gamma-glutamyl-gamma-aminobutyrate hydrolase PuuD
MTKCIGISHWGQQMGIYKPFDTVFHTYKNATQGDGLSSCDALLLWGGTDIHPQFDGQNHHKDSGAPSFISERDKIEWHLMHEAITKDIPIIGVCRGAQFACVFSGGSLYQHVHGHGSQHFITTYDGQEVMATSSHHQMMDIENVPSAVVLAATVSPFSSYYYKQDTSPVPGPLKDPEVVWFPETKALCIQPHPEWMDRNAPFNTWLVEQVRKYCL